MSRKRPVTILQDEHFSAESSSSEEHTWAWGDWGGLVPPRPEIEEELLSSLLPPKTVVGQPPT